MSIDSLARLGTVVAHLTAPSGTTNATKRPRPDAEPPEQKAPREALPSAEQLQKLADEVTASAPNTLSISIHEETGRFVVKVGDGNGEILRQFPSESALGLASRLQELRGLLFEGSAA